MQQQSFSRTHSSWISLVEVVAMVWVICWSNMNVSKEVLAKEVLVGWEK